MISYYRGIYINAFVSQFCIGGNGAFHNSIIVNNQKIYEELFRQFVFARSGVSVVGLSPVQVLSAYLALIREHLDVLRDRVLSLGFASATEEVWFFKHLKPKFLAEKIFRFEVHAIEMGSPVGTVEMVRDFLSDELRLVHRFFQQYAFLYQYYRSGAVELDGLYFVRGAELPAGMVVDVVEADPGFSTAMDYLFAKFIAFERLQVYLVEKIEHPFALVHEGPGAGRKVRPLRWTGDSINAVELGFALHDTGQLNDGKATLTEIFEWMADALNIVVKKPHRRFDEIEGRKIISKTDFTDRMRMSILNRIDKKNEYDPEKERLRRAREDRKRIASENKAAGEEGNGEIRR